MPYSFTPEIKPYVISSLYQAMSAVRPQNRVASTSYALGAQVINGTIRYIAIQDGVTNAGSGPTNATGTSYDGTVRWLALGPDAVQDGDVNSNLYLGLGVQTEWTTPSSPPAPDTSLTGQSAALTAATVLLKLDSTNLRLGLTNNVWTSGTVYAQYNPDATAYSTPYYAIVASTFVYKCLDNNNGATSVDSPSGTSSALIQTADGYIWKYVGQISGPEMFSFGTSSFVPAPQAVTNAPVVGEISSFSGLVKTTTDFVSTDTVTVVVQGDGINATAAPRVTVAGGTKTLTGLYATTGGSAYTSAYAVAYKSGLAGTGATVAPVITSGAISSVSITTPGSAYVTASVLIIGDGTGATATAVISSGLVTTINMTAGGTGYTWAKAFIIPGAAGGVAKAKLSPPGGHGSNLNTELGITSILISSRLSAGLSNYIPTNPLITDGSFRQITLVSGVKGTVKNAPAYLGPAHPAFISGTQDKYLLNSGFVLYMNNVVSVAHTSSQEEVIKISITL